MEFQVSEMMPDGLYSGRNCGDEIPIGFVFRKLVKYKFVGEPASLQRVELGEITNIDLKVIDVEFARRTIDCVPMGHTALIRLEGFKSEILLKALNSLKKHEYISLTG